MFADEAATIIGDAVCVNKFDLLQTKQLIFSNLKDGETPHVSDIKLVENCFIQVLADCACCEFEDEFKTLVNQKDPRDTFIRDSDKISTISDFSRLYKLGTYMKQLKEYSNLMDEYDLKKLIGKLKAYAWKEILQKSETGSVELEILQSLIKCFQTNTIPEHVREKLAEFNKNCGSQASPVDYLNKLMSPIEIETSFTEDLRRFLRGIRSLKSAHCSIEGHLLELIRFYLKPTEIAVENLGKQPIIRIIGGIIHPSEQFSAIENILLNNQQENSIDEVEIKCQYLFIKIMLELKMNRKK